MTRQEPRRSQQGEQEDSQYPEAKARGPWPVFCQDAAEQQSSTEADCLGPQRDQGRTLRTSRAAELQNRGGRRARRQADSNGEDYRPHEVQAMMELLWADYVEANPRLFEVHD
jgi:hypothetical protein